MSAQAYILVYNPISNEGHLDSWHVLFIELLHKEGWRVIALSTDPTALQAKLVAKGLKLSESLVVFQTRMNPISKPSLSRQAWQALNAQHDKVRYQAKPNRLGQYLKRTGVLIAYQAVDTVHRLYRGVKRLGKPALVGGQSTEAVLQPADFAAAVNEVLARYPGQVSKVLNMYIDAYRADQEAWQNFKFSESIPWAAVCITPGVEPTEAFYRLPDFQGACFLDEAVCAQYQKALPSQYFEYMPDIADVELPAQRTPLTKQLIAQAAGRKIVFMGGSIGRQKNLAVWFELVRTVDPTHWYFVQIGRLNQNNLSASDQLALAALVADHPANLMIYPDYLPDEREFNEVISVADVIFAVYRDFKRSSNMLSKAAYFEKPILVSDAHLMGERVKRYKIGYAVKEDDVDSIRKGLVALETTPDFGDHFEAYRRDFNLDRAAQRLSRFIQAGLAG
jgi:hypothetical protein